MALSGVARQEVLDFQRDESTAFPNGRIYQGPMPDTASGITETLLRTDSKISLKVAQPKVVSTVRSAAMGVTEYLA